MARQFFREWMKRPVCNGQSTSEGKRPTLFNLLTGGGEGDVGRRREEEDDGGLNGHFFKAEIQYGGEQNGKFMHRGQ